MNSLSKRIMLANGVLFVVVLALSYVIMTQERTLPGPPPLDELKTQVAGHLERVRSAPPRTSDNLEHLGRRDLFETIKPQPSPTPRPTPTPTPPPDIKDVTEFWRLSGALRSMAVFADIKTRAEFTIKVGESREVEFKGKKIQVTLKSTVSLKSATISINEMGIEQTRDMQMVP